MSFVSFVCRSSSGRRRLVFALAGLSLLGGLASAEAPPERPKIGLALGGGGAKGGAHVGVLKVMEELNIPVDYVAGTSIGAIVGGLYASGLNADEMADALNSIDWDDVMRDEPPRKDLNFRRKEDDQRYRVKLQLGLKDWKVQWPAGVMTGQKLYFMLQALTIQVADVENFDRLPIPFRCVATDIQTGDPVVLGRGNLANAMRASMAIPVAFTPVELDGRTLVDGGITNNIPVDVVREMGADIVIAVDLGAPLTSRQVKSLLEIRAQMMRMLIRKNMEPQLENAELVIHPEVSQYGTLDFSRIDENMKLGAEAAEAKRPELAKLAIAPEDYEKHRTRQRESRGETPIIDAIEFKGNQRVDDRIIGHKVRLQAGDRFDFDSLFDDISRIYGLGDFSQVFFAVQEAGDGRVVLTIDMVEKPWGPNYLHFGLSVASDLQGDNRLAALVNLTNTRLNSLGAEVRSDFQLGTRSLIRSELYQPLDYRTRFFVAPRVAINHDRVHLYANGQVLADLDSQLALAAVDLGYQISKYGEARVGYLRGWGDQDIENGALPPGTPTTERPDLGGIEARLIVDRLDNFNLPRNGYFGGYDGFFSRDSLGATSDYNRNDVRMGYWWTFGKNTILASLSGGWSAGGDLPLFAQFTLGGFFSLSGFHFEELRGDYYGVGRLGYYRRVTKKWFFGGWAEAGNAWFDKDDVDLDSLILAGTLFLGSDTIIGPVYVAYGHAEGGHKSAYLVLGKTF